jgi:hypothetical protein
VVEGLDLSAFEQRYSVNGEHAYSPRLLLKLWAVRGDAGGTQRARDRAEAELGFEISLPGRL